MLVEKPAFLRLDDYRTVLEARDAAGRVVLVGENDHYKPLAVRLRRLLADEAIGDWCSRNFVTNRPAAQGRGRLAQRRGDGRGRPRLRGRQSTWLHVAGSLGPKIVEVPAFVRRCPREGRTAG